MKTSELTGAALDWAVAKCEGAGYEQYQTGGYYIWKGGYTKEAPNYSTDWSQAGPIVEREKICVYFDDDGQCAAAIWKPSYGGGEMVARSIKCPSPLIAAMRCYVASKLGDEVEIPQELT